MTKKKDRGIKIGVSVNGGPETQTTLGAIEDLAKYGKRTKMENLYLPCEFTNEEMQVKAQDMANKLRERTTLENEKKRAMANFASQLKSMDGEIAKLSSDYSAGYEYRNVKCDIFIDYAENIKRWVRSDTGKIAKESKLTVEDLQTEIPPAEQAADEPEKKSTDK